MENKILVTGGRGLVGSEFIGDQYFKPSSKEYDLTDKDQTYRLMLKNFDGVANNGIKLKGDIHVTSLFPIEKLDINANIRSISAQKKDMEYFLKGLRLPDNISRLGLMHYKGSFKGNFSKFAL
jgi:dTDP-D-glucose 4,6-dehydratase